MNIFKIKNLKKQCSGKTILDIKSLAFEEGKIHAVLGPNGAGKTTMFAILAFLDAPSGGNLEFMGNPVVFKEKYLLRLRKKVVLVAQEPVLFSGTVQKNIEYGLKIRKIARQKRQYIVQEALELVGMGSFLKADAKALSGGEAQRVALARAVALSPGVLLCDEPAASVDAQHQMAIIGLLKQINREKGITIIFTSHDAPWAARLAHKSIYLDNGKIMEKAMENIFEASAKNGLIQISGADFCFHGPDKTKGIVRVMVDPEKIILADKTKKPCSETFQGVIVQISLSGENVRLTVAGTIYLQVIMPIKKYKEQNFLLGAVILLKIPPEAVQIMSMN